MPLVEFEVYLDDDAGPDFEDDSPDAGMKALREAFDPTDHQPPRTGWLTLNTDRIVLIIDPPPPGDDAGPPEGSRLMDSTNGVHYLVLDRAAATRVWREALNPAADQQDFLNQYLVASGLAHLVKPKV